MKPWEVIVPGSVLGRPDTCGRVFLIHVPDPTVPLPSEIRRLSRRVEALQWITGSHPIGFSCAGSAGRGEGLGRAMNAPDPVKLEALLIERAGVRRLVRGLLRDEHDVDDVVQDTWLTAIQRPPDPGRDPRPWLARVARNLAQKRLRSETRRATREHRAARPESMPPSDGIVERARTHRQVVDAVLALDEPYRTTILLRFFEGRTPRRIARETGVSVNTVNSRIQRGLVRLRRRLSRDLGVERSALGLALLPLIQTPKGLLMGALIMGAKAKIGLATALVLVATVAIYQLSDGDQCQTLPKPTPPDKADHACGRNRRPRPRRQTTEPPAKVAAATTADAPHPDASPAPAAPTDNAGDPLRNGPVHGRRAPRGRHGSRHQFVLTAGPVQTRKTTDHHHGCPGSLLLHGAGHPAQGVGCGSLGARILQSAARRSPRGELRFRPGRSGERSRPGHLDPGWLVVRGRDRGLVGKLAKDESQHGSSPDQPGRSLLYPGSGARCVPALCARTRSCVHAGCSQGGRAFGP